jgi:hypothetical protein
MTETGTGPTRALPRTSKRGVERWMSRRLHKAVRLGPNVVVSRGPETCPRCGSRNVMWGCDWEQTRTKHELHPLVWHETEWMADSYICRDCDAGWIETDDLAPVKWVRPYWR